jgi:hypothetical protein
MKAMESSTSRGPRRESVGVLIERMRAFWGKSFTDKWATLEPGQMLDIWTKALSGVSEIEFRRGVAKLMEFERPPSLPEFLKACRPEVNPLNAYYEALEGCRSRERGEVGTWSHPAIFWASVRVTAFELNTQSYSQIRQRWETALAAELAKDQWEPITAPLIQIAGPVKGKLSRESATKMIEQELMKAGAILKGGILADAKVTKGSMPVDGKGWARKIMQRHAAGDKTLMPIQIQFARQALGNFEKDNDE